jgi:rubrerythrin
MTSLSTRMVTALKTAIRREEKTSLIYEQKAKLATEEKVKAVLTSLAKQETGHARKLEKALERKDISSLGAKKSSASAGSLSLKNDDIRKLEAQTEMARVLAWAIRAEENSFKFYTSLSRISKGLDVAELFSRLAEEELKHKERLEAVLARL